MAIHTVQVYACATPAGQCTLSLDYDDTQSNLITALHAIIPIGTLTVVITKKGTGRVITRSVTGPATVDQDVSAQNIQYDVLTKSSTSTYTAQVGWSP